WIAVDSHSIPATTRVPNTEDPWAEQTFGPLGALCDDGTGNARARNAAGPCYAGRFGGKSDDANALATSKHVALARVTDAGVAGLDFAFSFDVVTTVADADSLQGSLRQFITNANSITGANTMRFVP